MTATNESNPPTPKRWPPTTFLRHDESLDTSMGTARIVTDAGPVYIKAMGKRMSKLGLTGWGNWSKRSSQKSWRRSLTHGELIRERLWHSRSSSAGEQSLLETRSSNSLPGSVGPTNCLTTVTDGDT